MRYGIGCLECGAAIATAERVGDLEAAAIANHLRGEHPNILAPDEDRDFAWLVSRARIRMVD
jgi:hypothetical protein